MTGKNNGNTREMKKMRNLTQSFEGHRMSREIHGNTVKANTNPLRVESNFKKPLYLTRFLRLERM